MSRLLCDGASISRSCLAWVILTACRSGEARGARWDEISIKGGLWTIPAERMKAGRAHEVPLSSACSRLLEALRGPHESGEWLFPSPVKRTPLTDMALTKLLRDLDPGRPSRSAAAGGNDERRVVTAHGFRTSFKTWAAEVGVPDEVSEAALAHVDKDKVRAAYRRTAFLDQRREVMQRWSDYCIPPDRQEPGNLRRQ